MSIIFLHWSSSGIALKRASTRAALATSGHTSGCASPSPYTTTHASTSHSVASSLAFFIRPLRRFLNVARRVESLAIHCRVTFFRAMPDPGTLQVDQRRRHYGEIMVWKEWSWGGSFIAL